MQTSPFAPDSYFDIQIWDIGRQTEPCYENADVCRPGDDATTYNCSMVVINNEGWPTILFSSSALRNSQL